MLLMKKHVLLILLLVLSANIFARDLVIDITRGVDNPTSIAIVPFQWKGSGFLPESVESIVNNDLRSCGQFEPLSEKNMPLSQPRQQSDIVYSDWRKYGVEYIVIGRLEPAASRTYRAVFELYDIHGQRQLFSKTATASDLRDVAHYVSDQIYEALTGYRGHFSTKIVYVRAVKDKGRDKFQLIYADQDGARAQEMLSSSEPLMSPTWSPNGQEIAYVSFVNKRPAIYRQKITGERQRITSFPGLNNAPAWSPDGTKMAMVLSKDDNPEIYVMDLASGALTRLTEHFGIDTEPVWMPDGKAIIFTSNRGGQPQLYRIRLSDRKLERLTFEGSYNARGRVTPDGKYLVMVHRSGGVFHIAAQDMARGTLHVLTQTALDESPTLAPNGRMLMYATKEKDRGILSAVSLDGGVKVRLPSTLGDVREPAWSPFLN
jgi:TolB protein